VGRGGEEPEGGAGHFLVLFLVFWGDREMWYCLAGLLLMIMMMMTNAQ
jgi:hypothetical protein